MRTVGSAAVFAVLVTLGAAALASGDATTPSAGRGAGKVIKLYAPLAQIKLLDLGDTGFSLGDEAVFTDDLLTRKNGKNVGFDGGVCTVVRVADAATQSGTVQCMVTFSLKGGQIATQGLNTVTGAAFTGTQVSAITGGTGRFRTARGEASIEFLAPGAANAVLNIRG